MKLTTHQGNNIYRIYQALTENVEKGPFFTYAECILEAVNQVLADLPQPTENTCQWIHCSERLPTKEDAGYNGYVFWLQKPPQEMGVPYRVAWNHPFITDSDTWWSPVPKNLVKPTPPDHFEELLKEYSSPNYRDANLSHGGWLKKAYELGKSQPK